MAHFYFDVSTNGVTVADEDGVDLLNAATALLEAARTAAEMMRDRCAQGGTRRRFYHRTRREPGAGLHRETRPHNPIAPDEPRLTARERPPAVARDTQAAAPR